MKKIISLVAILVLSLVVTGCSKNKILECSIDQSNQLNGNGSMKGTFLFHFKDTSLEKAEIKYEINITTDSLKEKDMEKLQSQLQTVCDNGMSGIKLSKCNVELKDKNVTLDATAMKDDFPNRKDTYGSIDKTKDALVAQGYECKIK